MQIDSLEQLERLILLARQHGVTAIQVGTLKVELSPTGEATPYPVSDPRITDEQTEDPYGDPDLYPSGQVPSFS